MTGIEAAKSSVARSDATPLVDPLLEAKLCRPPTRSVWSERARLMKRLDEASRRPVVLVAAPPGCGKTTVVTQWLASNRGPLVAGWISLDERDNDPVRLWTHVALALEIAGCPPIDDLDMVTAARGGEVIDVVLPRLLQAMAETQDEVMLVLDDFHLLQNPLCHRQVEFLVEHLSAQAHLMIITRADPGLRLGRLRATGELAELRSAELAFTADEASTMLAAEHLDLSDGSVQDLVQRTEGWAAGLYLVALSMDGRSDPDAFVREVSGSNRFIGDYLTEEVLAGHSDEVRGFIRAVSILDRFSAPLGDAMTGTTGSATLLRDLERSNLFLIPLDEDRTWFRFHHLLASVARSELEFEHPEAVPALHATAARWFRDHGHVDEAVTHSLASGSTAEAALLVQAHWLDYVDAGRTAVVLGWLDALGPESIETDPVARVTGAWMAAMSGDRAALRHHLAALEEYADLGPLPDGSHSVGSAIAMIQGIFGYGGPVEMKNGSQRALELETDGASPFYSIAHTSRGHAAYVDGDLDLAANLLAKASDNEAAPAVIRVLALSVLSLTEGERGHLDLSRELAVEAMRSVEAGGLRRMPQASVAFSALGQAQAASGELAESASTVERGLVLRRRNPTLGPWGSLHHLLAAARVAMDTGEEAAARHLADEATDLMDLYPVGMEGMRRRLDRIMGRVAGAQREIAGPSQQLTERELDVLRLLQGSLSLTEIAGELYISHNTAKTHAKALYRKLGASSRIEAVRIARGRLLV